jgi:hypothetical protein
LAAPTGAYGQKGKSVGDTSVEQTDVADVWRDERRWSNTANRMKKSIVFWRTLALALATGGAILATFAAQVGTDTTRGLWAGGVSAAALALVPVVRATRLGRGTTETWTRARSASEALKALAYTYLTRTPPYADGDRDLQLRRAYEAVLQAVGDLEGRTLGAEDSDKPLPAVTDVDSYLTLRVQPQIDDYYRRGAAEQQRRLTGFRGLEYALSLIGAVLGAISVTTRTDAVAAWVAVVTTVAAAITAHIAAARYEHLVIAYLTTARQLRFLVREWRNGGDGSPLAAGRLIGECENVISRENESWVAAWSRDDGPMPAAAGS